MGPFLTSTIIGIGIGIGFHGPVTSSPDQGPERSLRPIRPRFEAPVGTTLVKEYERALRLELDSEEWVIHVLGKPGELVTPVKDASGVLDTTLRVVLSDQYLSAEQGAPLKVERTFDELLIRGSLKGLHGRRLGCHRDGRGVLEGESVLFFRGDAGDAFEAASLGTRFVERSQIESLSQDTELLAFLPGHDVSVGDRWTVSPAEIVAMLSPGGRFVFQDEHEDPLPEMLWGILSGECAGELSARLEGVSESGDDAVATLRVRGDLRSTVYHVEEDVEVALMFVVGQTRLRREVRLELSIDGVIRWNLEACHLQAADIGGDAIVELEAAGVLEDVQFVQKQRWSGPLRTSCRVERP